MKFSRIAELFRARRPVSPEDTASIEDFPARALDCYYTMRPNADLSDIFLDLWSDPGDLRLTKVSVGPQARMEDMQRIGADLRRAAKAVLPKSV